MLAKIVVYAVVLVLAVWNGVAVDALTCNLGNLCVGSTNTSLNVNSVNSSSEYTWTSCIGFFIDCGSAKSNDLVTDICSQCTGGKINYLVGDDGNYSRFIQNYTSSGFTVTNCTIANCNTILFAVPTKAAVVSISSPASVIVLMSGLTALFTWAMV